MTKEGVPMTKVIAAETKSPPGTGWKPVSGGYSEAGGMRRKKEGGGYEYWYPSKKHAQKDAEYHEKLAEYYENHEKYGDQKAKPHWGHANGAAKFIDPTHYPGKGPKISKGPRGKDWEDITLSQAGGKRRKTMMGYEHWYPSKEHAKKDADWNKKKADEWEEQYQGDKSDSYAKDRAQQHRDNYDGAKKFLGKRKTVASVTKEYKQKLRA